VKSFVFGIPFANVVSSKGNFYSLSNIKNLKEGLVVDNEYGIYSREVRDRFVNRHKNRVKSFYGGVSKVTDKNGALVSVDNKVQLSWFYEKDHGDTKSLNNAIEDVIQDTGLDYLKVKAPSDKELGYINVSLKLDAGTSFTKAIAGQNQAFTFSLMQKAMTNAIATYFNGDDRHELCHAAEDKGTCKARYTSESIEAFAKIRSLSSELAKHYGKNNKAFAQTYAKIGAEAWTNQFVFKAMLEQMKHCGSAVNYEVSGEKISNYQLQNVTSQDVQFCK
jgi:hypothetical protein